MSFGLFAVFVLAGLCASEFSPHLRQHYFIDSELSWKKAQKYCRRHYTDLATVNDVQDLDILAELPGAEGHVSFVGLHKTWSWSLSDYDDYHEGETGYWNWANKQPRKHNCASIDSTGTWTARSCSSKLNFICYTASETNIPQRFTLVTGSTRTWLDAQDYCKTNYTDLARVRNQQENLVLQAMLTEKPVWFGLGILSWVWSDGSQPSFQPWKYRGNGDCGALVFGQRFHGLIRANCSRYMHFFCYSDPQKRHLVQLKFANQGAYINGGDPALVASINNGILRGLEEEGASTGVKLSWRSLSKVDKKQDLAKELKHCV